MQSIADLLTPKKMRPTIPAHCRLIVMNVLTTASRKGEAKPPRVKQAKYRAFFESGEFAYDVTTIAERLGVHPSTAREHLNDLVSAGFLSASRAPAKGSPRFYTPPVFYKLSKAAASA